MWACVILEKDTLERVIYTGLGYVNVMVSFDNICSQTCCSGTQ